MKRKETIKFADKLLTSNKEIEWVFNKRVSASNFFKINRYLRNCPSTCLSQEFNVIFYPPFSDSEPKYGIKKLPTGKNAAPDDIQQEFLIHLGGESKCDLIRLINLILTSGIHSDWRNGELTPTHKIGMNPRVFTSFHLISLTSVLCKLVR